MLTDLRFALRRLAQSPGFTVVAVLTLALGIGVNTSMFSIVNALLLRPLHYPDADQLVRVFGTSPQSRRLPHAAPYALELAAQNPAFSSVGLFGVWGTTLTEPGRPAEQLSSLRVSPAFLSTLGVQPALGRGFTVDDDRPGNNVAILTHSTWLGVFGADPDMVGRTVRIDALPITIIGVLPPEFEAPRLFGSVAWLRPLAVTETERASREHRWVQMIGRLPPGGSMAGAQAELHTVAARVAQDQARENQREGLRLVALNASGTDDTSAAVVWLTLGLAGFVLLIACANLASLQLVRASGRAREFAIRAALGASRVKLMWPLVVESLVVAILGGGAAILLAAWGNDWIGRQVVTGSGTPGLEIPLDGRVLAFAVVASLFTGLIFGTAPAWLAARVRVNDTLRNQARGATASRSQHRFRQALVIGEVALALVLLAGAGFFLGNINRFLTRDSGWNTKQTVIGNIRLPAATYPDAAAQLAYFERLRDRLADLPGVASATVAWQVPVLRYATTRQVTIEGRAPAGNEPSPLAFVNGVMPGYFSTLEIPLLDGRDFTPRDQRDAPAVVIVNEAMARTLWPGQNPLGQRIGGTDATNPGWMEVVGVARDVKFAANMEPPVTLFQVYRPFAQESWTFSHVALRTTAAPGTMVEPLRRVVAELDPDIPVRFAVPVTTMIERIVDNFSLIVRVLTGFALFGVLLAAIGVYGVISQIVAQRTPEIGVRIALGAQVHDVRWLVLGSGLRLALVGAALGAAGAWVLGRVLASTMPEVSTPASGVIALVTAALITVSALACWLPARRATKVDPLVALRAQ